mmetsp:Transcript_44676/g.75186  ORF Transcript_44676/g.75186 Transcript_44676/m.75186 type:complete len:289 (-) Transcript_44676:1226-2092(-)
MPDATQSPAPDACGRGVCPSALAHSSAAWGSCTATRPSPRRSCIAASRPRDGPTRRGQGKDPQGRPLGSGLSGCGLDQVRRLLRDHKHGGRQLPPDDARLHRGVHDPQALGAVHPQVRGQHGADGARAREGVGGVDGGAHVRLDLRVGGHVSARVHLRFVHRPERRRREDVARKLDAVDQRPEVVGRLEVIREDDRGVGRVGGAQPHGTARLGADGDALDAEARRGFGRSVPVLEVLRHAVGVLGAGADEPQLQVRGHAAQCVEESPLLTARGRQGAPAEQHPVQPWQ